MDLVLPEAAREFAASVDQALTSAGGAQIARRCDEDPDLRDDVLPLLKRLGALDLDPCGELDEVMAAVELCRVAGKHTLPWPVAGAVAAIDGKYAAVIDPRRPRITHGDLGSWIGVTLGRDTSTCVPSSRMVAGVLAPFVVEVDVTARPERASDQRLAALLWLQSATAIGSLQQTCRLTIDHVTARQQFGRRLADFQAVRFKLADMTVAERGLRELLTFTAWSATVGGAASPVVDALALRVATIEHGKELLRTAHQLHGALGFCDEHDLSVASRQLQPLLRMPFDLEASTEALDRELEPFGVAALCHDG